ncbi:nuclear transport factor 2 family protein [Subtercola boreus]|uniref:DUF4440 domain-containing protein n=1 Tax=Subtercola boreus TaxID=120213 RepID=A0A3E0WDB9_9MICO|nr:nuclear transport factor 2 family protein [Subtercola boreus]RFA22810.1 hypothetical protein B7R24_04205 [Subtercola boreus]RFA23165.1 hypothetical protein B7R23_04200 [Subtercola boreus]RFA28918.1 hypothetical protein B7R25_04215 [Subtercola boreus]
MTEHFAPGTDEHSIWQAMRAIYSGYIDDDRAASDANISPDATMWDSDALPLIHGRAELDAIRDARPPRTPADPVVSIEAIAPEVRIFGDTAVLLHHLDVDPGTGSPAQSVRNTSVWRRDADRWRLVHNHEDVTAEHWLPEQGAVPAPATV